MRHTDGKPMPSEGLPTKASRRQFLKTSTGVVAATMTLAAAQFGVSRAVSAQSMATSALRVPAIKPGTNTSFASMKQIDAGLLNVGYAEVGPADGPPVILLHGWPYDIHSFVDVAPLLASAGYRVVVPHMRGYGTTRFLSTQTLRNAEPAVVALDTIALMDALNIDKAVIGAFDLGARTANIIGALWPQRCKAMVAVSGYLISSQEAGRVPLPPSAEFQWWYQFYFAPNAADSATTSRDTISRSSSGSLLRRSGISMMRRSNAPRRRLTTRTTSRLRFTTIVGGRTWLKVRRNTMHWKSGLRRLRSSTCPRSRWRAMRMVHPIRPQRPTPRNSRANMSTDSLRAASGTTCPRKRHRRSRRRSSISTTSDWR